MLLFPFKDLVHSNGLLCRNKKKAVIDQSGSSIQKRREIMNCIAV